MTTVLLVLVQPPYSSHRWAFEVERGAEARQNAPYGYPVHDDTYPPTCHDGRHVSPPVVQGRLVSEQRHGGGSAYPGAQFGGHSQSAHAYPGQQTRGVPPMH